MSIRWRRDGSLVCAAMSDKQDGDTYIDDRLHYQLSVVSKSILADIEHEVNGLWHWVHTEPFSAIRALPEPNHQKSRSKHYVERH